MWWGQILTDSRLFQDVQSFNSVAEVEKFLLEHGEQVVDILGAEVDRLELEIKVGSGGVLQMSFFFLLL